MNEAEPWFILVAGINGAGKTTFAKNALVLRDFIESTASEEIQDIDPDAETRLLKKTYPTIDQLGANVWAAQSCELQVWQRIADHRGHFVIETVLSSTKFQRIVTAALKLNWRFAFVYVALPDVETAIERVKTRVANGGHDVPEATIRRRWPKTLANMPWFWSRATRAFMFENELDAQVRLAEKKNGKSTIFDAVRCPHATDRLRDL